MLSVIFHALGLPSYAPTKVVAKAYLLLYVPSFAPVVLSTALLNSYGPHALLLQRPSLLFLPPSLQYSHLRS